MKYQHYLYLALIEVTSNCVGIIGLKEWQKKRRQCVMKPPRI